MFELHNKINLMDVIIRLVHISPEFKQFHNINTINKNSDTFEGTDFYHLYKFNSSSKTKTTHTKTKITLKYDGYDVLAIGLNNKYQFEFITGIGAIVVDKDDKNEYFDLLLHQETKKLFDPNEMSDYIKSLYKDLGIEDKYINNITFEIDKTYMHYENNHEIYVLSTHDDQDIDDEFYTKYPKFSEYHDKIELLLEARYCDKNEYINLNI